MNLKKIRKIFLILTLILLAGRGGYWLGEREVSISWQGLRPEAAVFNKEPPPGNLVDFGLFWQVWKRVSRDFIDKEKIIPQKMVWGAISGMVQSLEDPYTVFLPPKENKEVKDDLKGSFEGIGAQLGMEEKRIVVIAPLEGMPAESAGILSGDIILKVDNEDTTGWTLPEAVSKIRGPKGSEVILTVLHEDEKEPVDIEVARGEIRVPSVKIKTINEPCQISHLKLVRFGDRTNEEWTRAVQKIQDSIGPQSIKASSFKGVVLDLRNNPGGYLQGAVFITSEFLKDGPVVAQQTAKGTKETFSVNRLGRLTNVPLVVLINQGSASASEIVAGALAEQRGVKIVGTSSFGKGSIQEAQDLPNGAGLHITTSKWLLPSGKWLNGEGLEPDVKIKDDPETEEDEQLEKAVEMLCY